MSTIVFLCLTLVKLYAVCVCIGMWLGFVVLTYRKHFQLEMWPMFNVMVALPNIGGALCSTPQSLADAHYFTAVQ